MNALRIFFVSALCAALAACESPRTGVDDHDLAVAAQQLESIAGEAQWLAEQVQARNMNLGMAWVHEQALAHDTLAVVHDLAKPVPERLRERHGQLLALGTQLQSQVTRIAQAAGERQQLESLQRDFRSVAQAAHPMGSKG